MAFPRAVVLLLSVALVAAPPRALAQAWPSKPIHVIVAYPPGGVSDVVARALAHPPERLEEAGAPAIVRLEKNRVPREQVRP